MLLLLATLFVGAAAAAPPTVAVPATVLGSADYFTNEWGDPMDFANDQDWDTTPNVMSSGGSSYLSDGMLHVTAGSFVLFRAFGGVIPTTATRDTGVHPVDATKYNRISFRMHSSVSGVSALGFTNCDADPATICQGVKYFNLRAGWHTYDLDMTGSDDLDRYASDSVSGWGGIIQSMFIVPSANGSYTASLDLDWVRLYGSRAKTTLSLSGGTGASGQLWYDTDNNTSNDGFLGGEGQSAGYLRSGVGPSGSTTVNLAGLPPGPYRFYTSQSGVRSAQSAIVWLDVPPAPVVIDPNQSGDDDWATVYRGDPWDFNENSDVWLTPNVTLNSAGGEGHGTSAGPNPGDPALLMNTNGMQIDATLYHHASVRIRYAGPWGLASQGGGMVGRFVWQTPGGGPYQVSRDFVLTTKSMTYEVDLKTSPPNAVLDPREGGQTLGWGGPSSHYVSLFRFDPHEDATARSWAIDEVRLTRNDRLRPNFNIRFMDAAWEPGTTAEVFADNDLNTSNGVGVAVRSGLAVGSGENSVIWDGRGATQGAYWIYVRMTDPSGRISGGYASGQLDVTDPPPVSPFGGVDLVTASGPGAVRVAGWAIDPDTNSPINVDVYVDGVGYNLGPAGIARPDLNPLGYGVNHGFDTVLTNVAPGPHRVCAYGINVGAGGNNQIGCRDVVVPSGGPIGGLDLAEPSGPGGVRVAGWAIDPDTASPIAVHVYVDGAGYNTGPAGNPRPDVSGAGYGPNHGFDTVLSNVAPGPHRVCAYGINVGAGANNQIGCRDVVVPSGGPIGGLDIAAASGPGGVRVAGWAIDPDTASPIAVHVYVDGTGYNTGPAGNPRPDLNPLGYGVNHGFDTVLTNVAPGPHRVCAYGINVGAGANNQIGCRDVFVASGGPTGSLDIAAPAGPGGVRVAGWAIDPDTASPIAVHVYVDGTGYNTGPAGNARPDLAGAGYGPNHGFDTVLSNVTPGPHRVCAYGINVGPGANNQLGCRDMISG